MSKRNRYPLFPGKNLILLTCIFVSLVSANGQSGFHIITSKGQSGFHAITSIPNHIYGLSFYKVRKNVNIGIFGEIKGWLSDAVKSKDGETYKLLSIGVATSSGRTITYMGAGPSWRGYYEERAGVKWREAEPWKLNFVGGVFIRKTKSNSPIRILSYQIGFDSQPLGISLGIGIGFDL